MKTATLLLSSALALAVPIGAASEEKSSKSADMMKKAAQSEAGKNASAKALAKVGMDVTPSAPDAKAYFIEPKDKAEVKSPVKVVFGLAGMGVAPAGTQAEHTGHHHLLIDKPAYDPNAPLPSTDQIVHFGKGQTEARVDLKPGKHTLQLVLGDWKHQPHNPPVLSETITVTVK